MEKIGPLVGRGYIAEVFAYGEDKVVKLFLEEDKTEDAEREARATAVAWESGLPAPKIWEVVTVNGRVGIVMERVEGVTMLHWGTSLPWRIYTGAKMMARMHADMHSRLGGDIPDLRDRLKRGIEENEIVEEGLRSLALERLVSLPDGDSICHGDFHPDNIMMSDKGPVIIDWQTGVRGHPAADVARTVVLIESGMPLMSGIRRVVIEWARKIFLSFYLKEYFRITGMTWEDVSPWLLPIAVNYVSEVFPEQVNYQITYARRFM